jgi:hypothetical protein
MINTPGMIGCPGKCPTKNGSPNEAFLEAGGADAGFHRENAVYEKKGVTVRQNVQQFFRGDFQKSILVVFPGMAR